MNGFRIAALAAWLTACGLASTESYQVNGVVEAVDVEARQVRIAHGDIPGFMPAMTMSFDVSEAASLDALRPGDSVRFRLERDATTLRITAIEVTGSGGAVPSVGMSGGPAALDPAPQIALTDHTGQPFLLSDQHGHAVLLDFVFTRCEGPCPILTRAHADLQARLPESLSARTRFVSVSIDPEHDTPERLARYAQERGADLESWSFLTGSPERVQAVVSAYHVGTIRQTDGTLDHQIVTFLIDPEGRIAKRYLGLEHPPETILGDLEAVLGADQAS